MNARDKVIEAARAVARLWRINEEHGTGVNGAWLDQAEYELWHAIDALDATPDESVVVTVGEWRDWANANSADLTVISGELPVGSVVGIVWEDIDGDTVGSGYVTGWATPGTRLRITKVDP